MKLPFSGRTAELETKNRILTDAARKKAERIKELEHQVAQWEHQVAQLKTELQSARKRIETGCKRASELEVVAAQRAHFLNEKVEELAAVREVLTQRSLRIQELEKTFQNARNDSTTIWAAS
jgi:chromosome segregation ATPase